MKRTLQELLTALSAAQPDLPFQVRFWDGECATCGSGPPAFVITFKTRQAAARVLGRGALGFGEEYVEGNIEVTGDFDRLVRLGMESRFQEMRVSLRARAQTLLQHLKTINTIRKAPGNIAWAYDLGNDFYRLYLDETMTYSCAYFKGDTDTLEQAQRQKYEHICRKLNLKKGETLVDVGCGWGGMLLHAAVRCGTRGVGCTLSRNQARYAQERVTEAGLTGNIAIVCEDYRNIEGSFDKFVSIGMFEHVGKRYIDAFMEKVSGLLKPGGLGLLHTVGKERDTAGDPWTVKYIFPGAYIPVLDQVIRAMGKKGLVPLDVENLRLHYAATLDAWAARLEANSARVERMFDEKLVRKWRLFLKGSAGAFRWGNIRVYQILFSNGINNALPLTRDHIYR